MLWPKHFKKAANEIAAIATGHGSCIASDRITVGGVPVGYCYREGPSDKIDSGWRFFAGDETQQYANESKNFEIYDVNTIANYDPDIIPLLDEPIGSVFVRESLNGPFVRDTSVPGSRE